MNRVLQSTFLKIRFLRPTLGVLLALLIGLKPVVDIYWDYKWHLLGYALNVQGLLAVTIGLIGSVAAAIVVTNPTVGSNRARSRRTAAFLLLLFTALTLFRILKVPGDTEILVKYWAGASGAYFAYLLAVYGSPSERRWLIGALVASFAIAWFGAFLQIFGIIGGKHLDFHPSTGAFYNITGFYFHPIDQARVVVWSLIALCGYLISAKGRAIRAWLSLFVLQAVFFRLSHRMSLLVSLMVPVGLGLLFRQYRRGAIVFGCILLAWGTWDALGIGPSRFGSQFGKYNFLARAPFDETDEERMKRALRGRGEIWIDHYNWISKEFTATQYLFGKNLNAKQVEAKGICPEPHNGFADIFENFGIVGLLVLFGFFGYLSRAGTAPWPWKIVCMGIPLGLSITSQPIMMPTMVWMFAIFINYPTRDGSFERSLLSEQPSNT